MQNIPDALYVIMYIMAMLIIIVAIFEWLLFMHMEDRASGVALFLPLSILLIVLVFMDILSVIMALTTAVLSFVLILTLGIILQLIIEREYKATYESKKTYIIFTFVSWMHTINKIKKISTPISLLFMTVLPTGIAWMGVIIIIWNYLWAKPVVPIRKNEYFKNITPEQILDGKGKLNPAQQKLTGLTAFHMVAMYNKNPDVILALQTTGADINARNSAGQTPLHEACIKNTNPEVIKALIDAGASVNALSTGLKDTSLHLAVKYNNNPEVIMTLLNAGADSEMENYIKQTPLSLSAEYNNNPDVIRALLGNGENINAKATILLHSAVTTNNIKVVTVLLNAGADVNTRDSLGGTSLHGAVRNSKNPEVIIALLNAGVNANIADTSGFIPFYYAKRDKKIIGTDAYQALKDASK